jgi:hypothetical protein
MSSTEKRQPWIKWFMSDWRSDPPLRMCSLAARGLWMDLLAIAHEAEPYGHILVNGKPPGVADIARVAGASANDVKRLLTELETAGVFSRTPEGVIFSRRMVRDKEKAAYDQANGKRGGNPKLKPDGEPPNKPPGKPPSQTGGLSGGDKAQKPEARSQSPEKRNNDPPIPASARAELMGRAWKALNVNDASNLPPNLSHRMTELVEGLLAENCHFESDIATALSVRPEGQLWPQSTAFWLKIARGNRDKRVANGIKKSGSKAQAEVEPGEWAKRLRVWKDHRKWDRRAAPDGWGPSPDEPGCLAPPDLVSEAA